MANIKLLDCTLRDGGYINDWNFGTEAIKNSIAKLKETNVDILEIGFFKDESYKKDRTVYNDVIQLSKQILPKKESLTYSVMIDVENPLPLDQLAPYSEETVDMISCIIQKKILKESFEYCKGIVEKGYKLSIQPERVDQYSYQEFIEMIEMFNTIQPDIFYVVDSFGTQTIQTLMPYMELADKHLKAGLSLGYHGHNNMMQAFDIAKAFCEMKTKRDMYIDASVYGMGRGAGNLNLELFAEYLNKFHDKNYNIEPMLHVYDKYLKPIYNTCPWGYSLPYYLTAINNCNPNYASYYDIDLKVSSEDIEAILHTLSEEDKIIYTKEKADEYLKKYLHSYWNKKIALLLPTANREKCIDELLTVSGPRFKHYGIDIIICDSSDNDLTRKVVDTHIKKGLSLVKYKRYSTSIVDESLDPKVIDMYKTYADDYEYLWACRDGYIINIDEVIEEFRKRFNQNVDALILYVNFPEYKKFHGKHYTDCKKLFLDTCLHLAILGTIIYSSKFIKQIMKEQPLDKSNFTLWACIAIFQYLGNHSHTPINIYSYISNVFGSNLYATPSSFWNKNGNALTQWGERWYKIIMGLPSIYDEYKKDVLILVLPEFTPFRKYQLIIMRINKSLTYKKFKNNKQYLQHVSDTSLWKFKIMLLVPRWLCYLRVEKPNNILTKILFFPLKIAKKIWSFIKMSNPPIIFPNLSKIEKDSLQIRTKFFLKQLVLIIPTSNRVDVLSDILEKSLQMYQDFGFDVIVYDSSDNNLTEKLIEEMATLGFPNLYYKKCSVEFDGISLDEKVMECYSEYCDEYEYIWVIRDRLQIDFNNCAYELHKLFKKKTDIISIHNFYDDLCQAGDRSYTVPVKFFREQFTAMTVLGQTIIRGDIIKDIIKTIPLDAEKNYGLWQPIAFFQYISGKKIKCSSLVNYIFNYHPSALEGSFWKKNIAWQFCYRNYTMFKLLPSEYSIAKKEVLKQIDNHFCILKTDRLIGYKFSDALDKKEIKKYEKYISRVTDTPVKTFYKIAKMPKFLLKIVLRMPNRPICKNLFIKDDSRIGEFDLD